MRPVSGFERPLVQWLFVALGLALIAIAGGEALVLRRAHARIESMRAADLNARLEREQLAIRLAHEQSAREALGLELGRVRGGAAASAAQPTLTLSPLTRRGVQPPEPTVAQPAAAEPIQLRLELPRAGGARGAAYTIVMRAWSGGETVWTRSGLAASRVDGIAMVTAFVTGDVLAPGAYELALTSSAGAEKNAEVASYEVAVRAASQR